MIRILLGSALPVFGLALAAGFAGPDLVTGLTGAPMVVAGNDPIDVAPARFDGDVCASKLLYGKPAAGSERSGLRLVAMGLGADGQAIELGIRDIPGAAGAPTETVVALFDPMGRLVAVSKPAELQPAAASQGDCIIAPKPSGQGPI